MKMIENGIIREMTAEEENQLRQTQTPENKLSQLRANLAETDYIACKIAEGSATIEEYSEQIAQRETWRQEIRELEGAEG